MNDQEYYLGRSIGKLRGQIYRLQRSFYSSAKVKLTVEEVIILNMINEKTNQILQNIAHITGKNKSVVMRMIDSLESKNLVKRTPNPNDRRENLLTLTTEGKSVVEQYAMIEKKLSLRLLSNVEESDKETFFKVISQIEDNALNFNSEI